MRATSWLLAACAVALAGAFGGTALDTTPVSHRTDVLADIPRHELPVRTVEAGARGHDLPDHYPLVTPEGVIEVAELAMHGRFRDKLDVPVYNYPSYGDAPVAFYEIEPSAFDYVPSRARFERTERLAHTAPPELRAAAAAAIAVSAEAVEASEPVSAEQAPKPLASPAIETPPRRPRMTEFAGAGRTSPE